MIKILPAKTVTCLISKQYSACLFALLLLFHAGIAYSRQTAPPAGMQATSGSLTACQVKDSVLLRNISTGQVVHKLALPSDARLQLLALDPQGEQLIISGKSRFTRIYDLKGGTPRKLANLPVAAQAVAFSHSGNKAYLLHSKWAIWARLAAYDTRTWTKRKRSEKTLVITSKHITLNGNDSLLAFPDMGLIKTMRTEDLKYAMVFWERSRQELIAFNPQVPGECATVTRKRSIQVRDLQKDTILMEIEGHSAGIRMLGYSPDGRQLFSLDEEGALHVWLPGEKKLVASYRHVRGLPSWDSTGALRIAGCSGEATPLPANASVNTNAFRPYRAPSPEVLFSPALGYRPETGFTAGLGLTVIRQPSVTGRFYRPSVYLATAAYGFDGSQVLGALSASEYFNGKWHLGFNLNYVYRGRNFYFGTGAGQDRTKKETFVSNNLSFNGSISRIIGRQFALGIGYDLGHNTRADFDKTIASHPTGAAGGFSLGAGPMLRIDNRDNVLLPARGHFLHLAYLRYGPGNIGDYIYSAAKLDYRAYLPLGRPAARRVLAFQAVADITWDGEVPFYNLPYVTFDKTLRGVYRNLYINRQSWYAQAEFRSLFTAADPRFGYAIFAGAADGAADLFRGYKPEIKAAYGLGLRNQVFPKHFLYLRLDLAFTSEGDTGIFGGIGTSF